MTNICEIDMTNICELNPCYNVFMKKDIRKTEAYKKFREIVTDEKRIAQSQKKRAKSPNPYIELKKFKSK